MTQITVEADPAYIDSRASAVVQAAMDAEIVEDYSAAIAANLDRVFIKDPVKLGLFVVSDDQASAADDGVRLARQDGVFLDRVWDRKNVNLDWYISDAVPLHTAMERACIAAGDGAIIYGNQNSYQVRQSPRVSSKNATIYGLNLTRPNEIFSTLTSTAAAGATQLQVADGSLFRVNDYVAVITDVRQGYQSGGNFITNINGNTLTISPLSLGSVIVGSFPIGAKVVVTNTLLEISSQCENVTIEKCKFDGNSSGNTMRQWQFNPSISVSGSLNGICEIRNCEFKNTPSENIFAPNGTRISVCDFSNLQGSFIHFSDAEAVGTETRLSVVEKISGDGCCKSQEITGHSESFVTFSANVYNVLIEKCEVENCFGDIAGPLVSLPIPSNKLKITNNQFRNARGIVRASLVDIRFDDLVIEHNKFDNCGDIAIGATSVYRGLCTFRTRIRKNEFVNGRVWFRQTADFEIIENTFRFNELANATTFSTSTWTQTTIPKRNNDTVYMANHGGALPTGFNDSTLYYVVNATSTNFQLSTTLGGSAVSGSGGSGVHYCWETPTGQSAAASDNGVITVQDFDRVRIVGNTIEAPRARNPFLEHGVYLVARIAARRRDSEGTQLNVLYPQGVRVIRNTVSGFRQGITCEKSTAAQWLWPLHDWTFDLNVVWGPWDATNTPATTPGWGIHFPAGAFCRNNVMGSFYVNNSWWPGVVAGLSTSSTVKTSALGAIVDGYVIFGPNSPFTRCFAIGSTQVNTENTHNVIVRNGFTTTQQTAHGNNGSANNSVVDPVAVNTSLISGFTAVGPIVGGLQEYTNVYSE